MYLPPVAFEHVREFLYFAVVRYLGARSNSSWVNGNQISRALAGAALIVYLSAGRLDESYKWPEWRRFMAIVYVSSS